MGKVARFRKFFVALGAGAVAFGAAVADQNVSVAEWWVIAAAIGGPLGVYLAPNKDTESSQ